LPVPARVRTAIDRWARERVPDDSRACRRGHPRTRRRRELCALGPAGRACGEGGATAQLGARHQPGTVARRPASPGSIARPAEGPGFPVERADAAVMSAESTRFEVDQRGRPPLLATFWKTALGFWRSGWTAWLLTSAILTITLVNLFVQYRINVWNRHL